jgi:hypothetical protein
MKNIIAHKTKILSIFSDYIFSLKKTTVRWLSPATGVQRGDLCKENR